jgi:flagellar hook-associated protein 2
MQNKNSVSEFGSLPTFALSPKTFSGGANLGALGIEDGQTITVNGRNIELSARMTMSEFATAVSNAGAGVSMSFSALNNNFSVTTTGTGADARIAFEGADEILAALGLNIDVNAPIARDHPDFDSNFVAGFRAGTNLVIEVNGARIETQSNEYTIDGTTITFARHAVASDEMFRIEVGKNPGAAVDVVKRFVEDYNALIRDITLGMLREKPSRQHHFLTDFDLEEMGLNDTQIANWTTLANRGLLHNNSTVSNVMLQLRLSMSTVINDSRGGRFGLHSIVGNDGSPAIRPSGDWQEMGLIQFDEKALLEALERNPDDIASLFSGDDGIMARMHQEIQRAINASGPESTHGSLVRRAGLSTGLTNTRNALHSRITSLNDMIKTLETRYEKRQERFWSQFTNMERQFASLNSQSDQIGGFFMSLFS